MLKIMNAYKKFSGINVLHNINIQVSDGIILGLAGASGSGKSTLLRIIQGFEKLDEGCVECNCNTGFMFQDFQLFPHMNVLQNVTYAPLKILKDCKSQEKAIKILSSIGMEDKLYTYPNSLSGGQKQRVALARSLIMEPKILLCDEPTSGLDVASISDVVKLLKSVHTSRMSMVIASHDLDFLINIANRILVLKSGIIVADVEPSKEENLINKLKTFY